MKPKAIEDYKESNKLYWEAMNNKDVSKALAWIRETIASAYPKGNQQIEMNAVDELFAMINDLMAEAK